MASRPLLPALAICWPSEVTPLEEEENVADNISVAVTISDHHSVITPQFRLTVNVHLYTLITICQLIDTQQWVSVLLMFLGIYTSGGPGHHTLSWSSKCSLHSLVNTDDIIQ